jgi:hypothetical protein
VGGCVGEDVLEFVVGNVVELVVAVEDESSAAIFEDWTAEVPWAQQNMGRPEESRRQMLCLK